MAFLAAAAVVVAYGAYQTSENQKAAGKAAVVAAEHQNAIAEVQAKAQEQEAGQSRASAQRAAIEERRRAGVVGGAAKARIAASGGALDSPDLVNTVAGIYEGGEYSALTSLYEGEDRARGLETAANISRAQGQGALYAGRTENALRKAEAQQAYVQAAGSLLSMSGSAYRQTYGKGFLFGGSTTTGYK